jgi:oligo-1,6-glucosidase
MTNSVFDTISDFHDVAALNYYAYEVVGGFDPDEVLRRMRTAVRDNARSPMQWDDSASAGFTTGEPWQRVNPNHVTINAAADVADPASVWHHYRRLIELRHTHAVVAFGDFTMLLADHPTVYAFTRRLDDETLLVIGNFSDNPITVDVDEPFGSNWAASELLLGNYALANAEAGLSLRPWECRVHRRRSDS